jgi:hypothetical protein
MTLRKLTPELVLVIENTAVDRRISAEKRIEKFSDFDSVYSESVYLGETRKHGFYNFLCFFIVLQSLEIIFLTGINRTLTL